jgi:thiol:disulfide interchange protein
MRSLVVVLALAGSAASAASLGCGKSAVDLGIVWQVDDHAAVALARAADKPLVVFVGAEWDSGSKRLENESFGDVEVRALLRRRFITLRVDATDDDDPRTKRLADRFKVIGTPAIIIFGSDGASEIYRINSFIQARPLEKALRSALRPEAVHEARLAARLAAEARQRADDARWEAERKWLDQRSPAPTVTITLTPE